MEKYIQENDIKVFYITASSFPEGISEAHNQLQSVLSSVEGRNFFGISFPDQNGRITYKAAVAETYDGEGLKYSLPTFVIRKGTYLSILIKNYLQELPKIDRVFRELTSHEDIDPAGYCLEVYLPDGNMRCMVPVDPFKEERKLLAAQLEKVFAELQSMIVALPEEQLNKVPFDGSWTAGQVADHLSKSYNVYHALNGNTTHSNSTAIEENIKNIKNLFLNFDLKFESPDFILPSNGWIEKETLLNDLRQKSKEILAVLHTKDLMKTCLDFELPGSGYITRLEWLYFVLYHTERHLHQLKNIQQSL